MHTQLKLNALSLNNSLSVSVNKRGKSWATHQKIKTFRLFMYKYLFDSPFKGKFSLLRKLFFYNLEFILKYKKTNISFPLSYLFKFQKHIFLKNIYI